MAGASSPAAPTTPTPDPSHRTPRHRPGGVAAARLGVSAPWLLAALVSGAAYAVAFPPYDVGWLAWVALVPLGVAAAAHPPAVCVRLGYAWGLVAFGGVLWWLVAFGAPVWLLAAAFLAVFPAIALGLAAWARRECGGAVGAAWLPLAWVAVEFLRSHGPLGFPWALAGESQHRLLAAAQIASVAGIWGVSFIVVLGNASIAEALSGRGARIGPLVAGGLVAAALAWGWTVLHAPAPGAGRALVAAVVQPDEPVRWAGARRDGGAAWGVLRSLVSAAAARGARLVVWPETAFPGDIAGDPAARAEIGHLARSRAVALIATNLEGGLTDSAFAFSPSGALLGRYDKVRLVPFAEFGERAGRAVMPLRTPYGPVGVAICFESVFPELTRRAALEGAGLLAVVTNDAWFSGPAAPEQHAAAAVFRAIEQRRYLLRAANSGISEIIDPRGRVLARLPLGARGAIVWPVTPRTALTPYARYGDYLPWGALAALGLVLVRRRRPAMSAADAGFARLLLVSAAPLGALAGAAWAFGEAPTSDVAVWGVPLPVPVLAALAATALLTAGRSRYGVGLRLAGFVPAAAVALAVVGCIAGIVVEAFAAQGLRVALVAPRGGWWAGGAVQIVVVGLTFEWWLRGLVYEAAAAWRNWRLAVAWSAVLGMLAASPRGAEAMIWSGCAGLAFGAIRTRWAQIPALALAHGVGIIALGFLLSPW